MTHCVYKRKIFSCSTGVRKFQTKWEKIASFEGSDSREKAWNYMETQEKKHDKNFTEYKIENF